MFVVIYRVFFSHCTQLRSLRKALTLKVTHYKAELLSLWTSVAGAGFRQCWMLVA